MQQSEPLRPGRLALLSASNVNQDESGRKGVTNEGKQPLMRRHQPLHLRNSARLGLYKQTLESLQFLFHIDLCGVLKRFIVRVLDPETVQSLSVSHQVA